MTSSQHGSADSSGATLLIDANRLESIRLRGAYEILYLGCGCFEAEGRDVGGLLTGISYSHSW